MISTVLAIALLALAVTATPAHAQSIYTPYAFTNFAGLPKGPGKTDGTGSAARFAYPAGVAVDSAGNVYVADAWNNAIRKVTPAGVVTTLAGLAQFDDNGNPVGGSDDGTGSDARFNAPSGVAVDSAGDVYVADAGNNTIRKITPTGAVTTLAGSAGEVGSVDGIGSTARFDYPRGVAVDSLGNVYVGDVLNNTIRKITPTGLVITLAGLSQDTNGDGYPDGGSEDGAGSAAGFNQPQGVAVDSAGNVYVADSGNHTIRKITLTGTVTTLAGSARQSGSADGTGAAARFYAPIDLAVDSAGNVYVADVNNHTIRKITPAGAVTTLAGNPGEVGSADGIGSTALFFDPDSVAVDSAGNVYAADSGNYTIRKITPAGAVTTVAGTAGGVGSVDGIGSAARFNNPGGVAVDSAGNVYVADSGNYTIRKITPAGAVTTVAGSAGQAGSADGMGGESRFGSPLVNGGPTGVAVDSAGNVYVADTGNNTIRKITPAGVVTTLAGSAGQHGGADGTGSAARFDGPSSVAVDSAGFVYVADFWNFTIRKITPSGVVTTLAGSAGQADTGDGTGSAARFAEVSGVAVDSTGNVYVVDQLNPTIRKITPTGVVTTLAGRAGRFGSADGIGREARFGREPCSLCWDTGLSGVAVDKAGNLYVADNNRIAKGTPSYHRFDTSPGNLTVSEALFRMRLIGPPDSDVIVESSTNLRAWTPVQTNALPSGRLDLSIPLGADQKQFFRARGAP